MTKIVISFILGFLSLGMIGCDMYYNSCYDSHYADQFKGHTLYFGEDHNNFEDIVSIEDIAPWISERVTYFAEYISPKDPKATLELGYGDCDDIVLLYMNILYVRFNIKSSLLLVNSNELYDAKLNISRSIVSGGTSANHAVILINDEVIEAQGGWSYGTYTQLRENICYIYSFDECYSY